MRVSFDTEFTTLDLDREAALISAGFVSEDGGHECYLEISDFPMEHCSQFVRDVVLPLLDAPEGQRCTRLMFGLRLVEWLASLDAPIELLADSPTDWSLLSAALRDALGELRHPLAVQVVRPDSVAAGEVEYRYWQQPGNRGKLHHALYDARCLRLRQLAEERHQAERRLMQQVRQGKQ